MLGVSRLKGENARAACACEASAILRLAIAAHQQSLDDRTARLATRMRTALAKRRDALADAQHRLAYLHPRAVVARERAEMVRLDRAPAGASGARSFARPATRPAAGATGRLDALSPLKVLARGYAIATRDDGHAIRSIDDVRPGGAIHAPRARRAHRRRRAASSRRSTALARGEPRARPRRGAPMTPRRFAVLGDPVSHSKSPAMQAAAFRALGLPHAYEAIRATAVELPRLGGRCSATERSTASTSPSRTRSASSRSPTPSTTARASPAPPTPSSGRATAGSSPTTPTLRPWPPRSTGSPAAPGDSPESGRSCSGRAARRGRPSSRSGPTSACARSSSARAPSATRRGSGPSRPRPPAPSRPSAWRPSPDARSESHAIVQATSAGMRGADPGEPVADAVD